MTHRTLTLTCDHCGAIARRHLGDPEHDSTITRAWHAELAAEGWSLGDGPERDTCPACAKAVAKPVEFLPTQEIRA